MFSGFLLFVLPIAIVFCQEGQYATSPTPANPCQSDSAKIWECVRNQTLFRKVDDILLSDDIQNQLLSAEISHVLNCFKPSQCAATYYFLDYLKNQRYILDYYHEHLEACAGDGVLVEITRICKPDDHSCLLREFLKKTTCGEMEFAAFMELLRAFGVSMEITGKAIANGFPR